MNWWLPIRRTQKHRPLSVQISSTTSSGNSASLSGGIIALYTWQSVVNRSASLPDRHKIRTRRMIILRARRRRSLYPPALWTYTALRQQGEDTLRWGDRAYAQAWWGAVGLFGPWPLCSRLAQLCSTPTVTDQRRRALSAVGIGTFHVPLLISGLRRFVCRTGREDAWAAGRSYIVYSARDVRELRKLGLNKVIISYHIISGISSAPITKRT